MKFFLILIFSAFCYYYQFDLCKAGELTSRVKRSMAWEDCPTNSTFNQCKKYATDKIKQQNMCARFKVQEIYNTDKIVWEYCGGTICWDTAGFYMPVKRIPKKVYPKCCPICKREN